MNIPHEDINSIIARALAGEADADDMRSLQQWLNLSRDHRKEFLLLQEFWGGGGAVGAAAPSQRASRTPSFAGRRYFWWAVAASAALLLVFTFMFTHTGAPAKENYILMTQDNISRYTLQDGTHITLNRHSHLSYEDDYNVVTRTVRLEGEAWFDVVSMPDRPFVVQLGEASVRVLGTKFNVHAMESGDNLTVTLVEGSVMFVGGSQRVHLQPNQQLTFNRKTSAISTQVVETDLFTSWKDGIMKYRNISLSAFCDTLERLHGTRIELADRLRSISISGSFFSDQSVDDILRIIGASLAIRWERQGDAIIVY